MSLSADNEILFNEINIRVDKCATISLAQSEGGTSMPTPSIGEPAISEHEIHEACCSWMSKNSYLFIIRFTLEYHPNTIGSQKIHSPLRSGA